MSKKFITKKTIVTGFLTALMTLGSASPFWDLPSQELDSLLGTNFSVTIYAADLSQFKDTIPQWATNDVSYLVDKGIIKGYDDGTFKANGQMTRLEFLTAVVRSLKTDAEIDAIIAKWKANEYEGTNQYEGFLRRLNEAFQDAGGKYGSLNAETFWGSRYLIAAEDMGLDYDNGGLDTASTALGSNVVNYDKPITREEACTVMFNACSKVKGESLPETKGIHNIIPDYSKIGIQRASAVGKLVSNGLIAGVDNNYTFAPKQTLKRSEACAIIARITDNSRRLAKPVVPEDKQEYIKHDAERDITYHNPVTGQDETRDINEWKRILNAAIPSVNGSKDGEYSKDGYYQWDSSLNMWLQVVGY